jgi:hypothetical protein
MLFGCLRGGVVRNSRQSLEPNLLAVCKKRSKLLQPSDHDAAWSSSPARPNQYATQPGLSRRCCDFVRSEHAASSARGAGSGAPEQLTGKQRQDTSARKPGPKRGPDLAAPRRYARAFVQATDQPRTKSPECDAPRPGCFNGVG